MKKQSLIHMHALLTNVRRELEESEEVPDDAFDTYEQFGVEHTSIHRSKDKHVEAIWHLLDGIDQTIEPEADQATPVLQD